MTAKEKAYATALLSAASSVAAGTGPAQRMQQFVECARRLAELDDLDQQAIGKAMGAVSRGWTNATFKQPIGALSADVQYDVDGTRRPQMSEQRRAELLRLYTTPPAVGTGR